MPLLTTQEQALRTAYTQGKISKQQYEQAMAHAPAQASAGKAAAPALPLPSPYWNLGTEVPGAQPYVSGEPAKPAYVAPPGYVITNVTPIIKTTKVMGGDPFKGWSSSETTETKLSITLMKTKETQLPISAEKFMQLQRKTVSPSLTSMIGLKSPLTFEQQIIVRDVGIATALLVVAPAALPFVTAKTILIGEAISVGATAVFSGGRATPTEYAESAAVGGAFAIVGSGVMAGIGKVTPIVYGAGIKGAVSRIGVLTTLGGGASYVLSGGNLEATAKGAAFSAVFGTGFEAINVFSTKIIQPRAQAYLTEHYLETGKLSVFDKAIMRIMGISSPAKEYIVSGQKVETWSLSKEESTINKALIPRDVESFGKKGSLTSWVKETQWQKPPSMESSLNQWVGSGQAQQLIMKPIVETMPKAVSLTPTLAMLPKAATQKKTGKTVVMAIPKTFTSQVQIQNPFLTFSGKPFYQQRSRQEEDEVYAVFSYPKQTPLATPKQLSQVFQIQTPSLSNIQNSIMGVSQAQVSMTTPMQVMQQTQRQSQEQTVLQQQKTIQRQTNIPPMQFGLGGGDFGTHDFGNLFGKWFGRKHPVKTWEQQLKTFGFGGKIPKSVSRLGKMEVPKGFKFGAPKTRRRRRKR